MSSLINIQYTNRTSWKCKCYVNHRLRCCMVLPTFFELVNGQFLELIFPQAAPPSPVSILDKFSDLLKKNQHQNCQHPSRDTTHNPHVDTGPTVESKKMYL